MLVYSCVLLPLNMTSPASHSSSARLFDRAALGLSQYCLEVPNITSYTK
jgi:hypothetical protein